MEMRNLEKLSFSTSSPQPRLNFSSSFLNFTRRRNRSSTSLSLTGRPWSCRRRSSARPPPPPLPDPPFNDDSSASLSGLQEKLTRIQDRVRIFFAVFFWMSLFFWGSIWEGRDDSGNKKGPPFRKKFK